MSIVLVTVAGPSGRRDLAVPADVPVGDLLGPVAAALPGGDRAEPAAVDGRPGVAGQGRWRLGPVGGAPLPPDWSLAACGIGDGATLTLTLDSPAVTVRPPPLAGSAPGAFGGAPAAIRRATGGGWGAAPLASRGAAVGGWSPLGRWGRGSRSRDRGDELLEAAIAAPRLRRCAVVGVVSGVTGIGRTTVAALLASVLAATREGLTVAVDVHPGPGSLTGRLAPDHGVAAGDLLGLLDLPALTTGELMACLGERGSETSGSRSASGFGLRSSSGFGLRSSSPVVVAGVGGSPAPASGGAAGRAGASLPRRAWTLLLRGLAGHAGALVLDCGPGLGDPGSRAALAIADQLVLVTEPAPSPESRRAAAALVDLGHAVVVVAASPKRGVGPGALARLLPGVRGVVALPPPGPVAAGLALPPRDWAAVPPWWRRPARQLAYLLTADWPALGMTVADG
jgi:hypothetical protein